MGTIFVAGAYGVGKSTMCELLSAHLCIPTYSAGDLISSINGERYGANKAVQDKNKNQEILTREVKRCLKQHPTILLAGHFCIFDKQNNVETLPKNVFESLCLESILLLEADKAAIIQNLRHRDGKQYTDKQIEFLCREEHLSANEVSIQHSCPLYIHQMCFDESDLISCLQLLRKDGASR